LLVVSAAEPTAFDPKDPLFRADIGNGEITKLKVARAFEHRG
jgi:hypothetical protein